MTMSFSPESPHGPDYHKSAEAKERCYSCSHPEKLIASEEDEALARQLVAEGYRSTSSKYCSVSRLNLPAFEEAVTFSDEVPRWMRAHLRMEYESWFHYRSRGEGVEHRTLTRAQFLAFKRLGGKTA